MELILKGRGVKITEHLRSVAERKFTKLERLDPSVLRLEVEVANHRNPRQGGAHRVEAAFETPRRTFRASVETPDLEGALDRVAAKLDRQIRDHRDRRRAKLLAGAGRVKSARAAGTEGNASRERRTEDT
jgi:ribosomal subunit interface protein